MLHKIILILIHLQITFLINIVVYKTLENWEKYPSQYPRAQGDFISPEPKNIHFTIMLEHKSQFRSMIRNQTGCNLQGIQDL